MWEFVLSALRAAIPAGTPLLLAALGEVYAERSGVLNLGVEGMMIIGAVTGFGVAHTTGNVWLGLAAAALAGVAVAMSHAFFSVTLRVNQVVSGIGHTMLGLGLSGLIGQRYIGLPLEARMPPLFGYDPVVYFAAAMMPALWFVLYRTRWGLTLRSVGENPAAADALGVNVIGVRYLAVGFGGLMAGLGGAYLSIVYAPAWIEGMTAGAGWIVIALTSFAMWDPRRAMGGAYLFGGVRVLQYRLQPLGVSPSLLNMLPFLMTIVVLMFSAGEALRKRIGAPAALMIPFMREER
jgi:simple sugar transport system permease protein